jgi:hypothetical protein
MSYNEITSNQINQDYIGIPDIGTLSGLVTDINCANPITGVVVKALQNGITKGIDTTDNDGNYYIDSLFVGNYDVSFTRNYYSDTIRTGVSIQKNNTTQLNQVMRRSLSTHIRPVNNATVSGTVNFIWNNFSPSGYTVAVATDPQLSDIIYFHSVCYDTTLNLDASVFNGFSNYYWLIQPECFGVFPPPIPPLQFTYIPDTVRLLLPENNDSVQNYPTFIWSRLPGISQYKLKVGTTADMLNIIWQTTINNDTSITHSNYTPLLNDSSYYWSVSALVDGSWRRLPSPFKFTKLPSADTLCAPSLGIPKQGDTVALPSVFSWTDTCGANLYAMFVFADSTYASDTLWLGSTTLKQITIPNGIPGLLNSGSYYWSVQGYSPTGAPSHFAPL